MGLFKSLRGNLPDRLGGESSSQQSASSNGRRDEQYQPPPGPPPAKEKQGENYIPPPGPPPSKPYQGDSYMPPPGPPPSRPYQGDSYMPPPGPPPSRPYQGDSYMPPPGPPPSRPYQGDSYMPPSGPPPSYQPPPYAPPTGPPRSNTAGTSSEPPPYHDWTVIPDTALLPPPPSLGNTYSPTGNAEESEAIRAHQWCDYFPLIQPHQPTSAQLAAVRSGQVSLQRPKEYNGKLEEVSMGAYRGSTRAGSKEACLLSTLPLYFAAAESPLRTEVPKTVYFEVRILAFGRKRGQDESSLAIGFCGVPYPTWRMPGWERGSLGVHSDDGRRYVNNTDGGIDFTSPFNVGETIGLGLTFAASLAPGTPLKADVFLTRNGSKTAGWNLHEEMDSEADLGVFGVDGSFDLFGSVGLFGEVSYEVHFNRRDWLWQPN